MLPYINVYMMMKTSFLSVQTKREDLLEDFSIKIRLLPKNNLRCYWIKLKQYPGYQSDYARCFVDQNPTVTEKIIYDIIGLN
jgi:hypothetical protein